MKKRIMCVALGVLISVSTYVPGYANESKDMGGLKLEAGTYDMPVTGTTRTDTDYAIAISQNYFSDTKGHWAESQINKFVDLGYIGGYADSTFKPNHSITRAEFVKILNSAFGLTKSSGKVFSDTQNHWARNEIDIAVTNGVCNGKSATEFKPNDPITREEIAVMIANYNKIIDTNHDKINTFRDKAEVASWAKDSVEGVIEKGYMGGYSDNTFRPKEKLTRAEAVVTLDRVSLSKSEEEKLEIDKANAKKVMDQIATLDKVITFEDTSKITNIRNAYNDLNTEAKALVTNLDILVKAENELLNVLKKMDNVNKLINALPNKVTLSDKDQVQAARKAYDDLSDVDKKGIPDDTVSILEAAELEIFKLETIRDNVNVQEVIADIKALPELSTLTTAHKDQVFGAMRKFEALPEDVKFAVDATDLVKAFDKVEGLLAVEIVNEINALPEAENIQLSDEDKIKDLRARYNELSEKNNGQVTNLSKLIEAEAKIIELEGFKLVPTIINKIDLLEDHITRDNVSEQRNKVDEIATLIYSIGNTNRQHITNIDKLQSTRKQVEAMERDINEVKKVEGYIDDLVSVDDIVLPLKTTVDEARERYEALSARAKTFVDARRLEKLEALENRVNELIDEMHFGSAGIEHLISLIEVLPDDMNELTYVYEETIHYARFLFNRLNASDQALITNISKLEESEAEWKKIKSETDKVTTVIGNIPSLDNLTLNDKPLVVEARKAYDSADHKVQEYVFELNYAQLANAEIKIEKLEKLQNDSAAKALYQKIEDLMNTELTFHDKEDVLGLRDDYYKLSSGSRELIDFSLIEKLEMRLSKLEAASK